MPDWKRKIQEYEAEYLEDLRKLVQIASVRNLKTAEIGAPFGKEIREAFDGFLAIAQKCGFEMEDSEGYACHVQLGEAEEYVGVLGHLDVVEAGEIEKWQTAPFVMEKKGDMLYGRGVNDDKGPLLAALYAARIIKDMQRPLKRSIRIIAGGAEETTWECMEHYFSKHKQPVMGFSPDGNFPIVNGEKGIAKFQLIFPEKKKNLQGEYEVEKVDCKKLENYVCGDLSIRVRQKGERKLFTWKGKKQALSRNPQRGDNVLWDFAEDFCGKSFVQPEFEQLTAFIKECLSDDFYGEKSGLYAKDENMGTTSVCPTGLCRNGQGTCMYLDIRYPRSTDEETLYRRLKELGQIYGFETVLYSRKRLLYVPEDSELILALKQAYEKVTGEEAFTFTKGGASYARTLDCGVAFGATFEGEETNPHMPNECMSLTSVERAMEIYCEALWRLAVEC